MVERGPQAGPVDAGECGGGQHSGLEPACCGWSRSWVRVDELRRWGSWSVHATRRRQQGLPA
eukprot:scaffold30262_cov96-Isochrysis_galbana.AAC.6